MNSTRRSNLQLSLGHLPGSRAGRVEDFGSLGGLGGPVPQQTGTSGGGKNEMYCSSEPGAIVARTESRNGPAASFAGRGRGGAGRSHRAVPYLRRQLRSLGRHARAAALELAVLATALPVQAQTPVQLVSNIGQQATTTPGYFNRFDAAQGFTTGTDTNGYKLTSVDIDLNVARRITGYVYSVGVWSATVIGAPETSLGTLTNPPFTTGNTTYTFTASGNGIDLNASTTYLVVVDVTTVGTGIFSIVNTKSNHEDTDKATGWSIADNSRLKIWSATGFWTLSTQKRKIRVNGYAKSGPPPPPPPPPPPGNFPTADAGPDQTGVWEGALVTLDGSGSSDPDDDPLRYRWNQLSGEPVVLSSRNVVNPTFTAPQGLTAEVALQFRLLVTDPSGRFDADTVTVTVDPEAEPPPAEDWTYYFPHLAVGAGWQTTITYINFSPQEVSCQTEFLSDQGNPLMVSFAGLGTVPSRSDVLLPGGSVHQETNVELSALLAPGWARAACSGPVKASLLYRRFEGGVPTGEAGVNAAEVPATRFVTFAEQGEGKQGTGVAYANPSDTEAVVTFTARDADGLTLASVDKKLSPNGHDAQNMAPLFGLSSFTGSLEVTSTVPIVSLSLNVEAAPVFSSLPPGELDVAAQGATTYYFPHLAVGARWQTTITYINYSSQQVSCQTEFLSDHGSPLMVSFADRGTVISRTDVLPPGGSLHEETNVELSTPLARGWARATCTGPLKASLLFRLHDSEGVTTGEAAVNATTVPATRFVTFAEQGEGQFGTGVAYANPSATSALVTFTAKDADGETLVSVDRTLLPGGHGAQNMEGLFDLSSFTGSLEVTSTAPIVSLSLNNEADPVFSSLPPGEVDAAEQ